MQIFLLFPNILRGGIEKNLLTWYDLYEELGHDVTILYQCSELNLQGRNAVNYLNYGTLLKMVPEQSKVIVFRGLNETLLLLLFNRTVILRLNNDPSHWFHESSIIRLASELFKRIVYPFADALVANSEELATRYKRYNSRISVVRNYCRLNNKPSVESRNGTVFVGRLVKQKNPELAIKFFLANEKKLDSLDIYGDGELMDFLKSKYEKHNIQFKGWSTNIPYFKYSFYIHTALYEGSPNSMIEAMMSGCVPITTCFSSGGKELIEAAGFPLGLMARNNSLLELNKSLNIALNIQSENKQLNVQYKIEELHSKTHIKSQLSNTL